MTKCRWCGNGIFLDEFKDELSKKEYSISGFCQRCQDKTFRTNKKKFVCKGCKKEFEAFAAQLYCADCLMKIEVFVNGLKLVKKKNGDYSYVCEEKIGGCNNWLSIPKEINGAMDDGTS